MTIDKEATQRIVKNSLGAQQIKADNDAMRKRNLMSSSDSEDSADDGGYSKSQKDKSKDKSSSSKLAKSKAISKPLKTDKNQSNKASRKDMHGATVVPLAAHLKYKKLLEKK